MQRIFFKSACFELNIHSQSIVRITCVQTNVRLRHALSYNFVSSAISLLILFLVLNGCIAKHSTVQKILLYLRIIWRSRWLTIII